MIRRTALVVMGAILLPLAASASAPQISTSDWPGRTTAALKFTRTQQAVVGNAFRYTISAFGSPTSFDATGLPRGLSVDRGTGVISGRPEVSGSFPMVLSAANADGTGTANVSLEVQPAPTALPVLTVPATIEENAYGGYLGNSLDLWIGGFLIAATNAPTSYAASGLPPGVKFDAANGVVYYDRNTLAPGTWTASVSATNALGTSSATVRWILHPRVRRISVESGSNTVFAGDTVNLLAEFDGPVVVDGTPYIGLSPPSLRARYVSGSGTTTLRFACATTLADAHFGVTHLNSVITPDGGTINHTSGISAVLSIATERLVVWDVSFPGPYLRPSAITSGPTANGDVAKPFSFTVTATNAPKQFRIASGSLPAGVTLAADTGVISGTPTQAGSFELTIDATNGFETSTNLTPAPAPLTIAIAAAAAPPPTTPPPSTPPPPTPPPSTPPPTAPPPIVVNPPPSTAVPAAQTITFSAPASLTVGQAVTINATASSGLPVTLAVVSGNATLSGTQLVANAAEPVILRGTQAGNSAFAAASADLTLSAARATQTMDFVSPVSAILIGQPVQLSAVPSSGLPVTFSIVSGNATVTGSTLTITGPGAVVVRATQPGTSALNAISADIVVNGARVAQTIAFNAPAATELRSDRTLTVGGTASSGLPVTFEVASGPGRIDGDTLTPTAASGTIVLRAVQAGSDAFEAAATTRTITLLTADRLINLSSRVSVREGDASRSLIAGFVVSGNTPKRVLVRAVGPALAGFGVQAVLPNPRLRVFDSAGRVMAENDDWAGGDVAAAFPRVGAFALAPGARDAALLATLPPGAYSLHVLANGGEGVALAEIYDASDAPALEPQHMVNLSTRGFVDRDEGVLTAGFVVTGSLPKRVLIRGVGPALAAFGVGDALADPVLKVFQGSTLVAQNDDWQAPQPVASSTQPAASASEIAAAATSAGAFALNAGAKDAAVLLTLPAGAYTATVSGAGNTTGAGMVEIYELATER